MKRERLKDLFSPRSVAVIGASNNPGKLGYHVMKSLVEGGYSGKIYPINPKREEIWKIKSYPSLKEVPHTVNLAIITVPAALVPSVLEECGEKEVDGVVVITAGFREIEASEGAELQERMKRIAERWELPIIGPNTFGFVNLPFGINATFTPEFSRMEKGGVALVSQSGGFCHLSGFLAIKQRVGFSKMVGLGNRANIDFPEMMEYLAGDPDTKVIALYIEGIDEPRRLMEAARKLKGKKFVLAYKAGRSKKGNDASRFHTGSLAGNYRIWQGALRQAGILEVNSTEELLDTAKVLSSSPLPQGRRIAVLSSQAGPGLIASDMVESEGLELARFSPQTQKRINDILPPLAIRSNPVDTGPAWYDPRAIVKVLEAVLDDEGTDGILFLNMFASANLKVAQGVREYMEKREGLRKPVIACFAFPPGVWDEEVRRMDGRKGFVVLPTPERAAKSMANLWRMKALMEDE